MIQDGETGILIPPYDIEAMRAAIQKLWQNPSIAKRMGLAARKYLEENFNPDLINSRRNELFNKIYQEHHKN